MHSVERSASYGCFMHVVNSEEVLPTEEIGQFVVDCFSMPAATPIHFSVCVCVNISVPYLDYMFVSCSENVRKSL